MAEYGRFEEAKIDRLFNLAKTNGGIVIAPYLSTLTEIENIDRVRELRKQIMNKNISFFPIFCCYSYQEVLKLGRTCFLIINKKRANTSTYPYMSREDLFQFGKELCMDYNKDSFDFLDNGEIKRYSKNGEYKSLYNPSVKLDELINLAIDNINEQKKLPLYIRTCRSVMEFTAKGTAGELFLWKEELPYCKKIEEESEELLQIEKVCKKLQPAMDYLKDK